MNNAPEHFIYDDEFYHEIEDLAIAFEDSMDSLPDVLTCYKTSLEPVIKLDADWIYDRISDERYDEEGNPSEKVYELLKTIDFTAINEKMPKLHYQTNQKFTITKKELLELLELDEDAELSKSNPPGE